MRAFRHAFLAALLCAAVPVSAEGQPPTRAAEPSQPSRVTTAQPPAERRAREYLAILGDADGEAIARRYIGESFTPEALTRVSRDDRFEDMQILRYELGAFVLENVRPLTVTRVAVTVRNGVSGRLQVATVEVEPAAPHRIVDLSPFRSVVGQTPVASSDRQRAQMLDAFVSRLASTGYFSGTVLLARDGRVLFSKAYGSAERRFRVPNTLDTRFHLGSITKLFTAVAIAQLVEQGRVSWDDPLDRFVPGFPSAEAARNIRLRHLLTHTSGLTNTPYPPGPRLPTRTPSVVELIDAAPRNPLRSPPGTHYDYNNLGYLLLGRVVEVVSGQTWYDYVRDHIFGPADMENAGTDRYDGVDQLSYAYEPFPSWGPPAVADGRLYMAGRAVPMGGSYATAADILRFNQALRSGALIQPSTLRVMSAPNPQLGAPHRGLGFSLGSDDWAVGPGRRIVGHGGNAAGVCTEWRQIDDAAAPYVFVILSNSGQRACFPVAEYILDLIPAEPRRVGQRSAE